MNGDKMKYNKYILCVIIGLVALGILYSASYVKYSVIDGCQFVMPLFGRIECEPISHVPIDNQYQMAFRSGFGWAAWTHFDKCGDDENSLKCSWYFKAFEGSSPTDLAYRFCTKGWDESTCDNWRWICNPLSHPCDVIPNTEYQLVVDQPAGTIIQVWSGCGTLGIGCGGVPALTINRFIPYGLNVYDAGMKVRYNTQSCDLGDLNWEDRYNVCADSDYGTTSEGIRVCEQIKESDRLNFDDWVNYLSAWVYAPMDINNKVVTWQGQQAYCQINRVYSIGEFRTENNCYKYPQTYLSAVDCCPGMQTANSICGDDFQWHPIQIGECQTTQDCINKYGSGYVCQNNECVREIECISDFECPYAGQDFCNAEGGSYFVTRYGCVSGQCGAKDHYQVSCCPPYEGCQEGYICNPNKGYICEKQVGQDIVCGDGICSAPYENEFNCPQDCEPFDWLDYIIPYLHFILFPTLGGIVAYAMSKKKKVAWTAAGVITGIFGAFIVDWFLKNWIWVVLGSILGIVGIVIVLLILAIVFPVALLIIGKAIGSARGKK